MAGADRAISVLRLFTVERPSWTVEDAATALDVSVASAYRYFAALTDAGLLTSASSAHYVLGPAIIQYDRQIQLTDPMLRAARPIMAELIRFAPDHSTILLCRVFRDVVLCVHQVVNPDGQSGVSYERGRPMPLFVGATSKVILAYLAARDLRSLYDENAAAVRAAKLGSDWDEFKAALQQIRKAGHVVTSSEIDPQRIGIAAPILDDRRVLGSLSFVIPSSQDRLVQRLLPLATAGAREIAQGIRALVSSPAT